MMGRTLCVAGSSLQGETPGPLNQASETPVLRLAPPLSSCGTLGRLSVLFLTSVKTLALVILEGQVCENTL